MLEIQIDTIDTSLLDKKIQHRLEEYNQKILIQKTLLNEYGLNFKQLDFYSLPEQENGIPIKQHYHLNELLIYSDKKFIENCYQTILHRCADPDGLNNFLQKLYTGKLSKIEIITRLRFSPEGRKLKIKISGLKSQLFLSTIYKIPVIGYLLHLFISITLLPKILEQQQHHIDAIDSRLEVLRRSIQNDNISNQTIINNIINTINLNNKNLFQGLGKFAEKEIIDSHITERKKNNECN